MPPAFVDTNILLYSIGDDPTDRGKCVRARAILASSELILSVQVFQEFYVQATRPSSPGRISHELALAFISRWRRFQVQPITQALFDRALDLCARYKLSYWDSAIIAAAAAAGCAEVLTEDMQHGAVLAGVRIHNPFLGAAP